MVALYWLLNFLFTYWFISEVLPTLQGGRRGRERRGRKVVGGWGEGGGLGCPTTGGAGCTCQAASLKLHRAWPSPRP